MAKLLSIFLCYTICHNCCHAPSSLQVKTTRNAVNIKQFACKIKAWMLTSFERTYVYASQIYASTSHKLFLVLTFAFNLIDIASASQYEHERASVAKVLPKAGEGIRSQLADERFPVASLEVAPIHSARFGRRAN